MQFNIYISYILKNVLNQYLEEVSFAYTIKGKRKECVSVKTGYKRVRG